MTGNRTENLAPGSDDRYRILHVVPGLGHGGAEHQLLLNVAGLDRSRFQSYVCHLFPRTILAPEIEAAGVPVYSAAASGPLKAFTRVARLVRLIRSLKIDLVHASNVQAEWYAGVAGRLTGVPAIATLTNIAYEPSWLVDNPNLNRLKLAAVRRARRLTLKATHRRYVAISEYVKQSTVEGFGLDPDKVTVIYRGVNGAGQPSLTEDERAALRAELGVTGHGPLILNVGRLVPQKGQRYLIGAMPAVLERFPGARLAIAGTGFLDGQLRELAERLDVADAVRFLGRRDDVPALLRACDMFVFPSLFEGLGVSLLEACDAGAACIATRVGPLPEVIEHEKSGLLVPPMSAEALSEAVIRLACDSALRESLGRAARERVQASFSIERSISSLEDVYESVLGSGASELSRSRA